VNCFEGGAIVTNNDELAEKIRLMKNFGFAGLDNVIYLGTNGKMSEPSAAMGLTSLEGMDGFIARNRANHDAYRNALGGIAGIRLLQYNEAEKNNYQYVVLEIDEQEFGLDRDNLIRVLHAENIRARRYFYPGVHRMEPYRTLYPDAGKVLPETLRIASRVLSLPTGLAVDEQLIWEICALIGFASENHVAIRSKSEPGR
jgi:dTDP-4-amino-4,6-dideoxygalactose transaminase